MEDNRGALSQFILVVEDDASHRDNLVEILSIHYPGYQIVTAGTAGCAADLIRQHQFAIKLILLDINLPDMSGRELYTRIERSLIYWMPPIIVVTGENDPYETIQTLKGRDIEDYIVKPYSMETLATAISKAFKNSEKIRMVSKDAMIRSWVEDRNAFLLDWFMRQKKSDGVPSQDVFSELISYDTGHELDLDLKSVLSLFQSEAESDRVLTPRFKIAALCLSSRGVDSLKRLMADYDCKIEAIPTVSEFNRQSTDDWDLLLVDFPASQESKASLLEALSDRYHTSCETIVFSETQALSDIKALFANKIDKLLPKPCSSESLLSEIKHSCLRLLCLRELPKLLGDLKQKTVPVALKKRGGI